MIVRLLFPGLAPRPHGDTRRMPPWGGGRGSAKQAGSSTCIPHHLPGNRSCQIVGWRGVFLAPWGVGGFFLHPLEWWVALGKGSACHFLSCPCSWPGVHGCLRPLGDSAGTRQVRPSTCLRCQQDRGTKINSNAICINVVIIQKIRTLLNFFVLILCFSIIFICIFIWTCTV